MLEGNVHLAMFDGMKHPELIKPAFQNNAQSLVFYLNIAPHDIKITKILLHHPKMPLGILEKF